jgi:hypothetical protein
MTRRMSFTASDSLKLGSKTPALEERPLLLDRGADGRALEDIERGRGIEPERVRKRHGFPPREEVEEVLRP